MEAAPDQILTVAQMRAAEQALIHAGATVEDLMRAAAHGAADWIWRVAAGQAVTVLCGPGNNGGDGYAIAEDLRRRGSDVAVVAAAEVTGVAAREMRGSYLGPVLGPQDARRGDVLVDCLFGIGLSRALEPADSGLIERLAGSHRYLLALDLPSGVEADSGALLSDHLPSYDCTLALGAWKPAHVSMPAAARMGLLRLVPIGIGAVEGGARRLTAPALHPPAADAHKYTRGLLVIVGGPMPGAGVLAARAAQASGAGYVKLLETAATGVTPADLVSDTRPLDEALHDARISAMLIGPGLGRDDTARERLRATLARPVPLVIDADALMLLESTAMAGRTAATVATPHDGEFKRLEQAFGTPGVGAKAERALLLAQHSGMVIVAKGPDTMIAAPDGRVACAPPSTSWLSTAGTGDVLAGTIASRLASGATPFDAACQGVWLHAQAARGTPPPFGAGELAAGIRAAFAACL